MQGFPSVAKMLSHSVLGAPNVTLAQVRAESHRLARMNPAIYVRFLMEP
jgi:hypothetical protein